MGGFGKHRNWTIAVGAINPCACFTLVDGDALGAPRTIKLDSHAQYLITKCREPQSATSLFNELAGLLMRCDHAANVIVNAKHSVM
jgi:hypothetical protein